MSSISTLLFFLFILAASPPLTIGEDQENPNPSPNFSPARRESSKAGSGGGRELWCVAKNNAEDAALQAAIDWACGQGGADCRPIQEGGPCYEPQDIQSLASYAFNDYYLKNTQDQHACDFSSNAAFTNLNPSHGNCVFPSSTIKNGTFIGSTISGVGPTGVDLNDACITYRCGRPLTLAICTIIASLILL